MKINDIRTSFLTFFESKSHLTLPSASLLPAEDPTLLFTSAGMVPFKSYFSGLRTPPSKRIATVQKCMRTTDLTEVGKTRRHLSLFEMLGNFSFGDYFKKEAIEFAWEYSTEVLPFDKEQIWITIFHDDDEAFSLWKNHIGIPENRIVRLGRKDNFWGPAGSTGACGPCSELYLDRGPSFDPTNTCHKPGDDGDRFLEFWNLVFNQFNFNHNQEYEPLKNTGIDTGAGLERLASLVQNVDSVYDTDELKEIRDAVCNLYKIKYDDNRSNVRILTDHIRTLVFSMADGIYPSNEARGYVLRRILRRALLSGRKLGQSEPLFYNLTDKVIEIYGKFYTELNQNITLIKSFIQQEENRFLQTLESGANRLDEILDKTKHSGTKSISGKDAFTLYDTFGFPLEMTIEVAEQNGLTVNQHEFDIEMNAQKQKGKQAWKGDSELPPINDITATEFIGYDKLEENVKITSIILNKNKITTISENETQDLFYIITNTTPFYAEGGGQLGDTGLAFNNTGSFEIVDTQKIENIILHICKNLKGTVSCMDNISIKINIQRRQFLQRNHSATHLLNAALHNVLGDHIRQSGSLVSDTYFRFDFLHPTPLNKDEIEKVETIVNEQIAQKKPTQSLVLPKSEAEKLGAMMTFGEKYGDTVRVIELGNFSKEFCGGTHVANTSEIGVFIIGKESGTGAGNRRIEGYSSDYALEKIRDLYAMILKDYTESNLLLENIKDSINLKTDLATFKQKIDKYKSIDNDINPVELSKIWRYYLTLQQDINTSYLQIKKIIKKQEENNISINDDLIDKIINNVTQIKEKHIYTFEDNNLNINDLKILSDTLRSKKSDGIFILQSISQNTWNAVLACSKKYADENKINLNIFLKQSIINLPHLQSTGGGGKIELAQANGKGSTDINAEQQKEIFIKFKENIIQQLGV